MIILHANGKKVEFPALRLSKHRKDFYWGLYCTNDYEQAKRWAIHQKPSPTINYYTYIKDPSIKIIKFEDMTYEWLDFIANCRAGGRHDYDIVEGPIASDRVRDFVELYLNDKISKKAFLEIAKLPYKTHQMSFHTTKALHCLRFEKSEVLT